MGKPSLGCTAAAADRNRRTSQLWSKHKTDSYEDWILISKLCCQYVLTLLCSANIIIGWYVRKTTNLPITTINNQTQIIFVFRVGNGRRAFWQRDLLMSIQSLRYTVFGQSLAWLQCSLQYFFWMIFGDTCCNSEWLKKDNTTLQIERYLLTGNLFAVELEHMHH